MHLGGNRRWVPLTNQHLYLSLVLLLLLLFGCVRYNDALSISSSMLHVDDLSSFRLVCLLHYLRM